MDFHDVVKQRRSVRAYRDDPVDFMNLSVENLRFAQKVVDLMNKNGAKELRAKGTDGPAMSRLIRDGIRQAK